MRMTSLRPFFALAGLGLLAGCSSVQSLMPHYDPDTAGVNAGANPRPVVRPAANPAEKQVALPVSSADIYCPEIDIAEGGSAYRVGGADNASVRYQFNISDTARECDPAGPGQASIKIGVAGNLVIGPAGQPGTFSVPLRIAVTDADTQAGLLQDLHDPGDCGRDGFRPVPHRRRPDRGADADAPARQHLLDRHRFRRRKGRRAARPSAQARRPTGPCVRILLR